MPNLKLYVMTLSFYSRPPEVKRFSFFLLELRLYPAPLCLLWIQKSTLASKKLNENFISYEHQDFTQMNILWTGEKLSIDIF